MSLDVNQITGDIIDTSIYIHKSLGPGLLEGAYEEALYYLLVKKGYEVERQKVFSIKIENHVIPSGFRADLVINDTVICELKSIEKLAPIHTAQMMTYLKLSGLKLGLLINFGEKLLKDGLKRIVM